MGVNFLPNCMHTAHLQGTLELNFNNSYLHSIHLFQRLGLRNIAQRNLEWCFNMVRMRWCHCVARPPVHRLYEHRRGPGSVQLRRSRRTRRVHRLRIGPNTNWRHYCRRLWLRRRLWRLYFLNLLPDGSTTIGQAREDFGWNFWSDCNLIGRSVWKAQIVISLTK